MRFLVILVLILPIEAFYIFYPFVFVLYSRVFLTELKIVLIVEYPLISICARYYEEIYEVLLVHYDLRTATYFSILLISLGCIVFFSGV
jgi:hypothetical protein